MANRDDRYFDINIDTGGDFTFSFTVYGEGSTPVDLTGAIVSATLREYPEGNDPTNFVCIHNDTGGQITISLAHEVTAHLGYTYGWYDIKVTFSDQTEEEVLHGKAFIASNVTRLMNPGTVNQIVAFSEFDDFPLKGNIYRIYLDQSNYNLYWWNGEEYVSLTYAMRGKAATIHVQEVETLLPGSDAIVENLGTSEDALLYFGIPRGDKGDAGTVAVGTVTTIEPTEQASIENVGTAEDAILNFRLPRGYNGFVAYATFEIDLTTGNLMMHSEADIDGANFSITEDGDLIVTV